MNKKAKGCGEVTTPQRQDNGAKVSDYSDMTKLLEYYRHKTGTTLDAAFDLKILRNSITYYVRDLEKLGVLRAIFKKPDVRTGRKAKYYSANPKLWKASKPQQLELSLFDDKEMKGTSNEQYEIYKFPNG